LKALRISILNGRSQQDDIWTVRPQGGGTDFYGARTTHRTGGINIISYTNRENNASDKTNPGTILDEEPTIFNDILIDGNVITNCDANGITTTNVKGELDDESYRHTNVVISNNEISDVSRSGIVALYTSGVLVEHNTISEFQQYPDGWGCGAWCDRANNMVYQYNEVKNGVDAYDGMAFNFDDMTHDGVIQYNYIHNNAGGIVMLHVRTNSYNRNNTVRYNVCVNDCRDYNVNEAFIVCTGEDSVTQLENAQVYNNTFISAAEINLYCTDYSALQEKTSEAQKLYDDGTGIYTQEEIDAAEIAVVKAVKELEKIEDTHITGDVNGDGRVEVDNATLIQEYLVLLADDINLEYADLNNDSKITVMDATIVQLIISGDYNGQ